MTRVGKVGRAIGRSIYALLAAVGFVFLIVTFTPLTSFWAACLATPWNDDRGDILIVLGGETLDNGVAGINSYWRSFYGVEAWREGHFHHVFITGDHVVHPMRTVMISLGVPAAAIEVETESCSTRENAVHSSPILRSMPGKKVLLTSDYHMFRARHAFNKTGIDLGYWPVPDVTKRSTHWWNRWAAFLDLVMESVRIGYYFFKGWI